MRRTDALAPHPQSMPTPAFVIVNPRAGGARRVEPELLRELGARGVDPELRHTRGRGHAADLASDAVLAGVPVVVAVGGDGTVHEVANGLLMASEGRESVTALGVVPAGTGNDFAKQIEGATNRGRAYDIIAGGRVRRFDAGIALWNGSREHFVNSAGTGIDVEVVRQSERFPKLPGITSYLVALLPALARYRPIPVRLLFDDVEIRRRLMIMAVGNGPCIGGGFYVCPAAQPDDGLFDICIVPEIGPLRIARTLGRVLRGTHIDLPWVDSVRAARVVIEAEGEKPLFFQLDGELRQPPGLRRIEMRVRAAVLPVLVPREEGP